MIEYNTTKQQHHSLNRNKKDLIRSIIMSVRETCAEWQRGIEPHDDPALKGKKDPDQGYDIKVIIYIYISGFILT